MSEIKETVCVSKQREERREELGLRTGSGGQLAIKHIDILSSLGRFFR